MRLSACQINDLATRCGFPYAVLLPAKTLAYIPNTEAKKQGIVCDPRLLMPEAQSVLVAALPFSWFSPWPEGCAEVSAFYFTSQRTHEGIQKLAGLLRDMGARVDTRQRLPSKLLGRDAGFGVVGRNSLLRNTAWGSCFSLRALVTDIEPPLSLPGTMPARACSDCRRCVEACPTGALDGQGNVDTEKCLRAHMLAGTVVPDFLREKMGRRLLGCEACQRACPGNACVQEVLPQHTELFETSRLLAGNRSDLDAIARQIGWNEARLQRVQAQAALAAGNSGNPAYLPLLEKLIDHERPAISGHAKWAVQRLKGD